MPHDSPELRADLVACLPSLAIEEVAAESGQRVVYFGRFDDARIPDDIPKDSGFLWGWANWGRVVIKVVAGASAEALTRLQAESAILAEVTPTHFPRLLFSNLFVENPVTDAVLPASLYVSIEEFIESRTLAKVLEDYVGKPERAVPVVIGIANALLPLWNHPKRFVHRDIKPENILLRPDDSVVVIDLGIVRETGGQGITKTGWGKAPLTVDYAAPEQIANDKDSISFKTDFFALGVLLYRMLAGTHPFRENKAAADFDVATAIETKEPPLLSEIGMADEATSRLVYWLLRKAPYQRPRTPAILLDSLNALKVN